MRLETQTCRKNTEAHNAHLKTDNPAFRTENGPSCLVALPLGVALRRRCVFSLRGIIAPKDCRAPLVAAPDPLPPKRAQPQPLKMGKSGFRLRGGGGSIEPPKTGGGGGGRAATGKGLN